MGMRPQMHLVFGIDDFAGELPESVYETQLYISDEEIESGSYELHFLKDVFYDYIAKEWGWLPSFLFWSPEFHPGVLGMSIDKTQHDSDLVRALSVFYPRFYDSGKRDLPIWDVKEHSLYAKRVTNDKPGCAGIEFQWSWFYPSVVEQHSMWPVHAYCTRWLLQQAGVEMDYHIFKAMLVWEWR